MTCIVFISDSPAVKREFKWSVWVHDEWYQREPFLKIYLLNLFQNTLNKLLFYKKYVLNSAACWRHNNWFDCSSTGEPNDKTQRLLAIRHGNLFNHISISFRSFSFQGSQGSHCLSFSLEINKIICLIVISSICFGCGGGGVNKLLLSIGPSATDAPALGVSC